MRHRNQTEVFQNGAAASNGSAVFAESLDDEYRVGHGKLMSENDEPRPRH